MVQTCQAGWVWDETLGRCVKQRTTSVGESVSSLQASADAKREAEGRVSIADQQAEAKRQGLSATAGVYEPSRGQQLAEAAGQTTAFASNPAQNSANVFATPESTSKFFEEQKNIALGQIQGLINNIPQVEDVQKLQGQQKQTQSA